MARDDRDLADGCTYEEDALGVPDHSTATPTREAEPPDRQMPPAETPRGADAWGTTAAEQRAGAPLDERLAEEMPDAAATLGSDGEGMRLADDGDPDDEAELATTGGPAGSATATAEEAAVHERAEAPGGTDRPDSYVGDDADATR